MTFILNIKNAKYQINTGTFIIKYKYCSDDKVVNCYGWVYVDADDYEIFDSYVNKFSFKGTFNKNKIKYFYDYYSSNLKLDKSGIKKLYKLISEDVKNTLSRIKEKEEQKEEMRLKNEKKISARNFISSSIDNILFKLNDAELSYKKLKAFLDEKINNHMIEKIL